MVYVSSTDLHSEFNRILLSNGFTRAEAETIGAVFTQNSVDGVYSHGVNRFPKFIAAVRNGQVIPGKISTKISGVGNLEQWDGNAGPGIINAISATDRAVELAKQSGIGCIALARTNHWMRGGTYGWQAARKQCIFIGWSNTTANTPAWGAMDPRLGNNPLVIAVPYKSEAIVLDMAMSQYSYGAMENYQLKGQQLPVPGGFDTKGELSTDPRAIKETGRTLPIGYWKGSGLSMLLDIVAVVLSGGLSVAQITAQGSEYNLSQIFIAIDLSKLSNFPSIENSVQQIVLDVKGSKVAGGSSVRYPGEQVLRQRAENLKNGVPVHKSIWSEIKSL